MTPDISKVRREPPVSKAALLLVSVTLVAAVLTLYSRTFGYGFVAYDDDKYVYENAVLKAGLTWANLAWALKTFYFANWSPLTWISYMTDVQFFGLNAGEMHAVNVLLHAGATVLLFLALVRMTRQPWRCALAAGLFALHPLNVQTVAWISDRKDALCAFFAALTLFLYAGYAKASTPVRYISVALAFALSLMAKTMAVTLPFVLLLLDFWPLRRLPSGVAPRRAILEKLPLIAMAAIASILTFLAQRGYTANGGALEHVPLVARAANSLVSYIAYIAKAVWPADLAAVYPPRSNNFASALAAAAVLLTVTAAAVKWVRRYPWFLTGWLWYLGMLVPVIGIVPQVGDQIMADRYVYLPMVGLWVAVVWTAAEAIGKRLPMLRAAAIVSLLWLGALAATAARQATYWADSRTLFEHALKVTDGNYIMANNLGVILARQPGEAAQAMALFRQALAFAPFHTAAHANLGSELMKLGQWNEARKHLETAVRLDPRLAAPQADLGIVMAAEGDYQEALRRFEGSLRLNPEQPEAQNNMCGVLLQLGRPAEAAAHCTEALKARPGYAKARINLARALALQGRQAEAAQELNLVLQRNPDDSAARQALLDLRAAAIRSMQ